MILELDEAREILRLDNNDNDNIITSLLEAIPSYMELSTGLPVDRETFYPLEKTAAKFILQLWYNAEQSESEKLQRTIDSLLKALSLLKYKVITNE